MIRVFISYSHADESYRNELEKHLVCLKHQGIIETWHDRRIAAGEEWANSIDSELRRADIILLLISSDFIASSYCYDVEVKEALKRHEQGDAKVIPVILRPCNWIGLSFDKLQAATNDGKPVAKYPSLDDAFLEITQKIKEIAKELNTKKEIATTSVTSQLPQNIVTPQVFDLPRSSNLAIPKTFSDHDKDIFVTEAFNYIALFFEGSLDELKKRSTGITTRFERVDTRSFETAIYLNGKQVSQCGIWYGNNSAGYMGKLAIAYSSSGIGNKSSFNEMMYTEDNNNTLGLKPIGMAHQQRTENKLLTNEGAAEYFWSMFFETVKRVR
jgi:hypothetical protein